MNEEMQKYLIGIIERTGEFLDVELPEIAEQILIFNLLESIFYAGVFACITAAICFAIRFNYLNRADLSWYDKFDNTVFGCILSIICLVFFLMTAQEMMDVIKITFAPKLFLLEYTAGIVKS